MHQLQIASDLQLPWDAVTETFAILAKRGVGKTYLASVLVEEMVKHGLPVIVIDPTGAWWGLRAAANGKDAGLPVIVLGGEHGDLPLTVDMAEGLASYLAETPTSMVIDLSLFSKGDRARFMAPFAETLYLRNRNPLHLVLDEADRFAPQKPMPDQNRMLGAIDEIVRMGRLRGLGITMITQRPAVLNKDVLTQIEVLIALRTIGPQDRKAIDAWIDEHGTPEERAQFHQSLPSLPIGTAWFWSPGWLQVFQKIQVRQRDTFNSSATPKVGEKRVMPKLLAKVDLEPLQAALRMHLEKADDTNVSKLQRKVLDLQKQLQAKPTVEVERVEVPVLRDDQIEELKTLAGEMIGQAEKLLAFGQDILTMIAQVQPPVKTPPVAIQERPKVAPAQQVVKAQGSTSDGESEAESGELKDGEMAILKAIARRHPTQLTLSEIATLSGRSIKSSSFHTAISLMKRWDYITGTKRGFNMTESGLNYLGDDMPSQPQTTAELLAMWQGALQEGEYKLLDLLVGVYPDSLSKVELSELSGYSIKSSSFSGWLGRLARNGLMEKTDDGYTASPTLFIDELERV